MKVNQHGKNEMICGKIIKILSQFYYVQDTQGKIWECFARSRMIKEGKIPLVGDNLEIEPVSTSQAVIVDLLERENKITKPTVANIDQVLVVFSSKEPALELYNLDRYLSFIKHELPKEEIIICINKIDLAEANIDKVYKNSGFQICYVSALTKKGLDDLSIHLPNKTTVLTGPSGVGKSSIIKALAPESDIKIGDLSKVKRGKHITRHTELITVKLNNESGYLVDTPGFTQIEFGGFNQNKIRETFKELINLGCSYENCLHTGEEGCVLNNREKIKEIPASRLESYLRILEEARSTVIYKTKEESMSKTYSGSKQKMLPKIKKEFRAKSRKRVKQELRSLDMETQDTNNEDEF